MELKKITTINDIQKGDQIIIDGLGKRELFTVIMVKVSEKDGTEIILNKKKNLYFNLGMYLSGLSWVKECVILV